MQLDTITPNGVIAQRRGKTFLSLDPVVKVVKF